MIEAIGCGAGHEGGTSAERHEDALARRPVPPIFLHIAVGLIVLALLIAGVHAASELLDVASCSGVTCGVAGLNSDDTAQDGATIPNEQELETTWSNTTFHENSSVDEVLLIITHSGEAGIGGVLTITFSDEATTTTYCSFTVGNNASSIRDVLNATSGCSWTPARLDDLAITIRNDDVQGPQDAYLSFLDLNVSYTPPDLDPPRIELVSPDDRAWDLDGAITFTYIPSDDRNLSNCTLVLDGLANESDPSPTNGSSNTFGPISLEDGNHTWAVNCTDASGNVGNSTNRTVRVDTTPPQVLLELPQDDNYTSNRSVRFRYNASDTQTSLQQCELLVDGEVRATNTSIVEDQTALFRISLVNGEHNWSINCTDANGFESSSAQRNISINASTPPNVTSIVLDDGLLDPPDSITLLAGSRRSVLCNATVRDVDGIGQIVAINATLYGPLSGPGADDDPRAHYTNTSCRQERIINATDAIYHCGFAMAYYAMNGSWTCNVSAYDAKAKGDGADQAVVEPLFALNITPTLIAHGNLSANETGDARQVNITNLGNRPINVTVWSYGALSGDNLSFACGAKNITASEQRFSTTQGAVYASMQPLSGQPQPLGLTIAEQQLEGEPSWERSYLRMRVPIADPPIPVGTCSGSVVYEAVMG